MIGIGFIGAGGIAALHAEALRRVRRPVRIVGAFDVVPEAARRFAAATGSRAYAAADELIGDRAVDAVYICTRHDSHWHYIRLAAEAGKAIFCEKPLALTLEEAYIIEEVVRRAGVPFAVGFNHRFVRGVQEVRSRLALEAAPCIVHVTMATAPFLRGWPGLPDVGGGVFHCLGSHVLDLVRYVVGELPASIVAFGARQRLPEEYVEDAAVALLRFPSGSLASVNFHDQGSHAYSVEPGRGLVRLEAFQDGRVAAGFTIGDMLFDTAGRLEVVPGAAGDMVETWGYLAENDAFLAYLSGEAGPRPALLEDGVNAARLVEAAIRSHKTGAVVSLAP